MNQVFSLSKSFTNYVIWTCNYITFTSFEPQKIPQKHHCLLQPFLISSVKQKNAKTDFSPKFIWSSLTCMPFLHMGIIFWHKGLDIWSNSFVLAELNFLPPYAASLLSTLICLLDISGLTVIGKHNSKKAFSPGKH